MKVNLGTLSITSAAFKHGERIPVRYSGDGEGLSPPLAWQAAPEGTRSFAMVSHDPDAPLIDGFTHWVLYGIPADVTSIDEGGGGSYIQGVHGMGEPGWVPPSPPPGHGDHFYYFHVYALGADVDLEPGLDRSTLLALIDEHVIEQARIVGVYGR